MTQQDMAIFTRTFDFLTWLLPATNHFPRAHRHTFTRRLLDAAFDLRLAATSRWLCYSQRTAPWPAGHAIDPPGRRRPSVRWTPVGVPAYFRMVALTRSRSFTLRSAGCDHAMWLYCRVSKCAAPR